ncbi:ABC transporter ATP-binding protein [Castellaniella sp. UC4442_H9]
MLEIRHLSVGYARHPVIRSLSAGPLPSGRIIALLGPNGSGKSTLLKALAGLLRPSSGQILLGGADIARGSPAHRARQVAYLPQSLPAAVHLRVLESVLVAAHVPEPAGGVPDAGAAADVLHRLGIAPLAMRYLDELSGGQKQLVGLAQALIRQPRMLLLDEPLSALDLHHQWHVMDVLARETRQHELTTLVVLHDLNMALQRSDEVLLIHEGNLVAHGAPAVVITPGVLADVYQIKARVETGSQGFPHILIDSLLPRETTGK